MTARHWACGLIALAWLAVLGLSLASQLRSSAVPAQQWTASGRETAEPQEILPAECGIAINTATLEELMTLPGIGEARAKAIIENRETYGSFRYPEDLLSVSGIGAKRLADLAGLITTAGQASRSEESE